MYISRQSEALFGRINIVAIVEIKERDEGLPKIFIIIPKIIYVD
jgi:hypothetical protein